MDNAPTEDDYRSAAMYGNEMHRHLEWIALVMSSPLSPARKFAEIETALLSADMTLPIDPTRVMPRGEVMIFARAMELQLRKHDGEYGDSWKSTPLSRLRQLRYLHTKEYEARGLGITPGPVLLAAADVANFLMFECDVKGKISDANLASEATPRDTP